MLTKNNNNNASENCIFGGFFAFTTGVAVGSQETNNPNRTPLMAILAWLKWGWGNDQGLNEKEQEEEYVNENP